jgi:hypothetical protein
MIKTYSTTDTAEAAFLMAHGMKFIKTERVAGDSKMDIILEEISEGQSGDLLMQWDDHSPEKAFFLKYKFLLKRVVPRGLTRAS